MTLKASTLPARLRLDTLFTATIEAWWYHTLASTMPTWTQKLITSAASSSLTTARYTEMRFKEKKKKHQNAIVEEQLPLDGSLLGFFLFYFLMPWSSLVIFSLFLCLTTTCNRIAILYSQAFTGFSRGNSEPDMVRSKDHPQGDSEKPSEMSHGTGRVSKVCAH